jgi:hypothetical protein
MQMLQFASATTKQLRRSGAQQHHVRKRRSLHKISPRLNPKPESGRSQGLSCFKPERLRYRNNGLTLRVRDVGDTRSPDSPDRSAIADQSENQALK